MNRKLCKYIIIVSQCGYIVFVIGNTIRKAVVTVMIGKYIHRVIVIKGSLFSREYSIIPPR